MFFFQGIAKNKLWICIKMIWMLTTNIIFYNFRSADNFLASEIFDFLREHDINNNRWEHISQ